MSIIAKTAPEDLIGTRNRAALGTGHRINLIDLLDHLRPALEGDALQVLLD
jgi:hypothetical protein